MGAADVTSRRALSEVWVVVAIALVPVAFFSPIWATGRVFFSDGQYSTFFAPAANWSNAWIGGWAAGADTAAYVWYPLRLLMLWSGLGWDAFIVSAYVLAALGTYGYLRTLDVSPASAGFGAVSFALSGFMVAHLVHTSMIQAAAWVPWMFLGVEGHLGSGRRRWIAVTAVAVAMACLAGHMQIAFYGLFTVSAYLVWRFPAMRRAGRVSNWVLAVGGIALGLVLAAPQILMTLDYIAATPRALLDYEAFVAYSLPWAQLSTLLFPFLFGGMGQPLGTPYFGADNFAELCLYVPFLSVALALAGAVHGPPLGPRSAARFWALVAVVALLLALGGSLPALAHVVYRLPGFDLFRVPARHVLELTLSVSVLAAFGLDWLAHAKPARWWLVAVIVLAALVVVSSVPAHRTAAAAAAAASAKVMLPEWSRDPAIGMGVVALAAGLVAIAALMTRTRTGGAVFAVCAVFGLGSYAWLADWRLSSTAPAPQPTAIESDVAARLATNGGRVFHAQGGWNTAFTAGRTRTFGIPSLNWYGPLIPLRAQELLQITVNGVVKAQTLFPENAVLDVYGVRYVAMTNAPSEGHLAKRRALAPPRWREVANAAETTVYENQRALPLAWLTPAWREVAPEEARALLQKGGFDPRREALVSGLASGGNPEVAVGAVDARWSGEGSIRVAVDTPTGGFLVVSVNDVAGWTATVDGVAASLFNADYALVGLPIAAGRHRVELGFRVPAWQWVVPWGVALLGGVVIAAVTRRK